MFLGERLQFVLMLLPTLVLLGLVALSVVGL